MLRTAAGKVMWVGRATVFLVGLAVILALVVGVASTAMSATGGNFLLGKGNVASTPTSLGGTLADATKSALVITNKSGWAVLDLKVQSGAPPMKANSSARVDNLNADLLDGKDSSDFVGAGQPAVFAAGQIRDDGSVRNSVGSLAADGVTHPATGFYCIAFSQSTSQPRLESAVVGLTGDRSSGRSFPRVQNG